MRTIARTLRCLCLVFLLSATSAAAQVAFADREALAGPWQGLWQSDTHEYAAVLKLRVRADGEAEGSINWTLLKSNRPDYQSKIAMTGTEHVRGRFDPATMLLSLDGYELDDPNKILGTDKYRLVVGENRKTMAGITWSHGSWTGRIFLRR